MQNFRARVHCALHCAATTLATSLWWSAGTVVGQALAGAAISITVTTMFPGIVAGLTVAFATMPVYIIVTK